MRLKKQHLVKRRIFRLPAFSKHFQTCEVHIKVISPLLFRIAYHTTRSFSFRNNPTQNFRNKIWVQRKVSLLINETTAYLWNDEFPSEKAKSRKCTVENQRDRGKRIHNGVDVCKSLQKF